MALKPGQHRIDNIAEHAASMLVFEEENENSAVDGNANATNGKNDEALTKKAITRKKLQALSVHDGYDAHRVHNSICSPSNNSMCSQSTALSRARSEIEGRRKSRAAARARIDAVLDEIQSPRSNRDDANERAWAALEEVQKSRSMKSLSNEEEEHRQPGPSLESSSVLIEETREEYNEDRVGKVISFGKSNGKKSRTNKSKGIGEAKKSNSKDKKNTKSTLYESKLESSPLNDQDASFVLSEEALLAVSQAAFEKVAPDVAILESLNIHQSNGDKYRIEEGEKIAGNSLGETGSLASSRNSASKNTGQNSAGSGFTLSEADVLAVSQAALDVSAKIGSFEPIQEEPTIESMDDDINASGDKYEVQNMNVLELDGDASRRDSLLAVSEAALNSTKVEPLKNTDVDSQKEVNKCEDASNRMKIPSLDQTFSEASTQPCTKITHQVVDVKESKEYAREATPKRSNNTNNDPSHKPSMSPKPTKDPGGPQPSIASKTQDVPTHKSEGTSNMSLSTASSSWTNEDIEKKSSEINKEMGALDSMMFQKLGVGLVDNANTPRLDTGLTNNSDVSGNSSYSSEQSNDLSPNKSMGPIWQKALDDAKALSPKSEKQNKGLVRVDDETVADDDTMQTTRPGFSQERLQYTVVFGFLFLLMNSLFVVLDSNSFAIRVFGLVGLISSSFPLMVMCMFLMSSQTQYSFWACSVKSLLIGCLSQVCILILFILATPLGAGSWAAGIISSAALLALTVEMNMNSPVSVNGDKTESSHLMIGDMMKCLVLFGLSPGDDEDKSPRKKKKRKKKNSRLLEESLNDHGAAKKGKQKRLSEYKPPIMPSDIV